MTKKGVLQMQNAFLVGDFGECGEILVNQIDSIGEHLGNFGEQIEAIWAWFCYV